ncbi:hypothetical protein EIP91_011643 [Steccherinum ochraceum]|uniref:Peptide hydrolase n=1 Tax=Steccherinum ochraceum TaxID=92696 RepID=A0A4R0RLJ1_9APHY|nr:hypothetical protein EIP91_011643 [Steccherinum ochraceum]
MGSPVRTRWGPIQSMLYLSPLLIATPLYALWSHYALPQPITELTNPITSLPQISESQILAHAKYLSEDIGYRTVGSREHALGDAWMFKQALELQRQCEEIIKAHPGRKLQCETWRQEGSGSHRFDFLQQRLYKTYRDLSNIVVRVSDGTEAGKEHAVLVNSHLDSTLPSPGAADDALSVGVMLECLRVLINTPNWEPTYSIVFLFNNAEESLQDGSHLYSTQHPTAQSVRAVINLEACGTTGPELLFQATSEEMIQAYSRVPRPFGTVIANEVFSSGVIMSDTDFRQFELYLNVTGLDMAVVGNSYLYHTGLDLVENIEPGVAQHMAENTLALLQYLSSAESPLPTLTSGYTKPTTVFFYVFHYFFIYSFSTAKIMYAALLIASVAFVRVSFVQPAPALRKGAGVIAQNLKGLSAHLLGLVGAVLGANAVAFIMSTVLNRSLSWFSVELSCLLLYGALLSQFLVGRVHEQAMFTSLLLLDAVAACAIQALGVGSAAMFFIVGLPLFIALVLNSLLSKRGESISLWSYAVGQFVPLSVGAETIFTTLDVFVPLTGRMGADAPGEHIIASIVAFTGAVSLPLLLPFIHRFPRIKGRALLVSSILTTVAIAVFSAREPFDKMHPKRLFVIHMENITTSEQHLHIAAADGAPGFHELAHDFAKEFSLPGVAPTTNAVDNWNGDWDTLYPFSHFITPYKLDLPLKPEYLNAPDHDFSVTAVNDTIDAKAGTRSFTLVVQHPGIIWTAVAFDAHVLSWDLDDSPPDEYARHHIKEGSFYGHNVWKSNFVVKLPPTPDHRIKFNFVGIHEKAMWPGKAKEKEEGGRAMQLLEDLDSWLKKEKGDIFQLMLLGCVGGIALHVNIYVVYLGPNMQFHYFIYLAGKTLCLQRVASQNAWMSRALGVMGVNVLQASYALQYPPPTQPQMTAGTPVKKAFMPPPQSPPNSTPRRLGLSTSASPQPQKSFGSSYAASPLSTPSRTLNYSIPASASSAFDSSLNSSTMSLPNSPSPVLNSPLAAYRGKHSNYVAQSFSGDLFSRMTARADDDDD